MVANPRWQQTKMAANNKFHTETQAMEDYKSSDAGPMSSDEEIVTSESDGEDSQPESKSSATLVASQSSTPDTAKQTQSLTSADMVKDNSPSVSFTDSTSTVQKKK